MGKKIYVTSDLHLNHPLAEKERGVNTTELISNINYIVQSDDELYIIGDFILGDPEQTEETLKKINCKNIHVIIGNHDTEAKIKIYKQYCISVDYLHYLRYKGYEFIMCHYPIFSGDFISRVGGYNRNTYLLYGHLHTLGYTDYEKHLIHIGIDSSNYQPLNLDDIVQKIEQTKIIDINK